MRFLFYDRILEMQLGKRVVALKTVALSEEFFPEHYPRRAVMPATLMIECLAQVAGWLTIASHDFKVSPILCLIEGVRIFRHAQPGDHLKIEARILFSHKGGATYEGEVSLAEKPLAQVERMVLAYDTVEDEAEIKRKVDLFNYMSGNFKLQGEGSDA